MSLQNLTYLSKHWLGWTAETEAASNIRKWTAGERKWVLRHHDEENITDEETWLRDYFDNLLGFYSIVEIAVTIGFVSDLPMSFRKRHLPVLCDAAVRRYYELNYQLDLPR